MLDFPLSSFIVELRLYAFTPFFTTALNQNPGFLRRQLGKSYDDKKVRNSLVAENFLDFLRLEQNRTKGKTPGLSTTIRPPGIKANSQASVFPQTLPERPTTS
jgi:hypothetical protein